MFELLIDPVLIVDPQQRKTNMNVVKVIAYLFIYVFRWVYIMC